MPRFRVYIEETSVRLFSRTVEADSFNIAHAIAQDAINDDTWTAWDHSSADATLEVRDDLTARLRADGSEERRQS